jgi:hypothetical protein
VSAGLLQEPPVLLGGEAPVGDPRLLPPQVRSPACLKTARMQHPTAFYGPAVGVGDVASRGTRNLRSLGSSASADVASIMNCLQMVAA